MQSYLSRTGRLPPQASGQRGAAARALLFVLALVVLVCAVAGTTYAVVSRNLPTAAETAPTSPPPPKPVFIELEPFTVTVSDPYADRILHVGLTLRVDDDSTRQRLMDYLPEIRSQLLVLLSEQRPDALQSGEGKRELASQVRASLNSGVGKGQVMDVLFHAFVVQ